MIIIELMSMVSFLFSILTYIIPGVTISNFMIIFLLAFFLSYIAANFKKKNKGYLYVIFLIFIPVLKYNSISDVIFLSIAAYYIYYYIFKCFGYMNFEIVGENFKRRLYYLLIIIFSSFVLGINPNSEVEYIPFMLIYFISTIMFLRSLRHLEHDPDIKKISRTNFIYFIVISISSLIFSIEGLRNTLFSGIKGAYNFVVNLFVKLIYWPTFYLVYWGERLFRFLINRKKDEMGMGDVPDSDFSVNGPMEGLIETESGLPDWLTNIILIVAKLAVVFLIIFVTVKLFKKRQDSKKEEKVDYTEEREFINIKDKKKKKRGLSFFKPKDMNEQIRYYYKKYLLKIKNQGVPIGPSDTSLDINNKAKNQYKKEDVKKLREIYIDNRYGEKEVNKTILKEMKKIYKDL